MTTTRSAILSVSDKAGLVPFAQGLSALGWRIISTGGTAAALAAGGVDVTPIEAVTGFPEGLDGRVKTLHPAIHAGILFRRDVAGHKAWMREHGLASVDMVVVNLYPFVETVKRSPDDLALAIENIDIGGPSMLRSAAKNHAHVVVVCDPGDYEGILAELRAQAQAERQDADDPAPLSPNRRLVLSAKAFRHTAAYDAAISQYLTPRANGANVDVDVDATDHLEAVFPSEWTAGFHRSTILRYGENPHQAAALYLDPLADGGLARATPLQGKPLSYNNLVDAEAAWRGVWDFSEPACVAIKHLSPCGIATGATPTEAFLRAKECDPVSIFGGILAFNRKVDSEVARAMKDLFFEVLIAPDYDEEALVLLAKKKNLRILLQGAPNASGARRLLPKAVSGGLLLQEGDSLDADDHPASWKVVTARQPSSDQLRAMSFAWRAVRLVRSNAIVLALADRTIGIGGGQTNRVDAVRQSIERARETLARAAAEVQSAAMPIPPGAALASDAFFPFADSIEAVAEAGIRAIVQPGGSIRDKDVIAAADELGIAMCFTGKRHFLH